MDKENFESEIDPLDMFFGNGFMDMVEKISNRILYLFGEVETESILQLISEIKILESKSNEDIEIIINSPGGYVTECFALIDIMDASPCDFIITVLGQAASAACLIASNGTPGKRFSGKNSEFMFHEVMGFTEVREQDLAYIGKETKRTQQKFNKIFSRNTGQKINKIKNKDLNSFIINAIEVYLNKLEETEGLKIEFEDN